MSAKKYQKLTYNESSADFVPIACHFDEHTLITKNGELLQTIQIHGLNANHISNKLHDLRAVVRKAISDTITNHKYSFWVHTIRRRTNLDDPAKYSSYFSGHLHDIWKNKHNWDEKHVNTLYITIIHEAPILKLTNYSSLVNSLSTKKISDFEKSFSDQAIVELTETVDKMLEVLSDYGATKLGIYFEDDDCYSDLMFLYRRIMQLDDTRCPVVNADISNVLSDHRYVVGNDMIEVASEYDKKFATIISLKEYQEVPPEALDRRFLQIPVDMVVTEVFYFVDRREVTDIFKEQNYILSVSGDDELRKIKSLDRIFDKDQDNKERFCHQQISCMIIGDDLEDLERQRAQVSKSLSEIGIAHVREDINLEKTFWSQLPGNFSFLSRMNPTVIDHVAALSSLHNHPTGSQYSPWGRAVTLIRAGHGAPYFFNFHDSTGYGTTCIFGDINAGKTTMLNFILSETDKFQPQTTYITNQPGSEIYIKLRGGEWNDQGKHIVNPLRCGNGKKAEKYLKEFFKIVSKHYFDPLSKDEQKILDDICSKILETDSDEREWKMVKTLIGKSAAAQKIQKRLEDVLPKGKYANIFEIPDYQHMNDKNIRAYNLAFLDETEYSKKHFPKEKRLIEDFEYLLDGMSSTKMAIIYALHHTSFSPDNDSKKIFVTENITRLIKVQHYQHLISEMASNMQARNGIAVFTANNDHLVKMTRDDKIQHDWIKSVNTSLILPSHFTVSGLEEILMLTRPQYKKLTELTVNSRSFLIRHDEQVMVCELGIRSFPTILKMLCSNKKERQTANELYKKRSSENLEDWVEEVFGAFDQMK